MSRRRRTQSGGVLEWWSIEGMAKGRIVPEGLDEGSDSTELAEVLAIFWQGSAQKESVPLGYGMME